MGIADEARRDAEAKQGPDFPILGPDEVAGEVDAYGKEIRRRYIQLLDADAREVEWQEHYASLAGILDGALEQASSGKGAERHANNQPFENQPIMQITRLLDGHPVGALAYQAIKKIIEAGRLYTIHGPAAAVKETMGAINYAAAMAIRLREMGEAPK